MEGEAPNTAEGGKSDSITPVGSDTVSTIQVNVGNGSEPIDPRLELFIDGVIVEWRRPVAARIGTEPKISYRFDGREYGYNRHFVRQNEQFQLNLGALHVKSPFDPMVWVNISGYSHGAWLPANSAIPIPSGHEVTHIGSRPALGTSVPAGSTVMLDPGDLDMWGEFEVAPPSRELPDANCFGRGTEISSETGMIGGDYTEFKGDRLESELIIQPKQRNDGQIMIDLPTRSRVTYGEYIRNSGSTMRIELGRIDVHHVLVEGIPRPGHFKVTPRNRTAYDCSFRTGTGIDVLPGDYTIQVFYPTASGTKSNTYNLSVGSVTWRDYK